MRILCLDSINLDRFTMENWRSSFRSLLGEAVEFEFWNPRGKAAFDIFDEYEPDLFIAAINDATHGITKCLEERPELITLFYSNPQKEITTDSIDRLRGQIYIFNFSPLKETLAAWQNRGYKTINIPRAISTEIHSKSKVDKKWNADLAYIGDYEPRLDKYILPLSEMSENPNLKLRIYGEGWQIPQAVGKVQRENLGKIFSNTTLVLDINENMVEPSNTLFNCLGMGTQCLTNCSAGKDIHGMPMFYDSRTFHNLVLPLLSNDTNNTKVYEVNREILLKHTYPERISFLLTRLRKNGCSV